MTGESYKFITRIQLGKNKIFGGWQGSSVKGEETRWVFRRIRRQGTPAVMNGGCQCLFGMKKNYWVKISRGIQDRQDQTA